MSRLSSLLRYLSRPLVVFVAAVACAGIYGLIVHFIFTANPAADVFPLFTLSLSFLCGVPIVLGVLVIAISPPEFRGQFRYYLFAPVGATLIFGLLSIALSGEAWICVAMALPIVLVVAALSGAAASFILRWLERRRRGGALPLIALLAALPFWMAPVEHLLPLRDSIRSVESSLVINASAEAVWTLLTQFPEVRPDERRFSWYHFVGLPRPIGATLMDPVAGGLRRGQWENGLVFVGTITEWSPAQRLTVALKADTSQVHGTRLPLAGIGGPFFDVLDDQYTLEPLGPEQVRLHLSSTYRLTTRFNRYGALWTDFFMRDLQRDLLAITAARAESVP